jgi:hypothetical protein
MWLCLDSESTIISVAKFLNYVKPQSAKHRRPPDSSTLTFPRFTTTATFHRGAMSPPHRIPEALWWEESPDSSYVIIVSLTSFHIIDVAGPVPFSDIGLSIIYVSSGVGSILTSAQAIEMTLTCATGEVGRTQPVLQWSEFRRLLFSTVPLD